MYNPDKKTTETTTTETTGDLLVSYHTVSSYELDSFGHVNNANFLNFLEGARCDFMTQRGLHFDDFFKWKRYPVVTRAELNFKWPAKSGDRLKIKGWIPKHRPTGFTMQYEITLADTGKLILTGETNHVFVDDNNRPSRIPQPFADNFIRR